MTISIGLPLLPVDVGSDFSTAPTVLFASPMAAVATPADGATEWLVKVVEWDDGAGAWMQLATYPTAEITAGPTYGLDVPARVEFDVAIDAPDLRYLQLQNPTDSTLREVQVFRNGQILFFGPMITRRCDTQARKWHYTCEDPLWYLTHRFIGEANRRNYLTYDADTTHWTTFGSLTATDDTVVRKLGTTSLKLVAASSGENFKRRTVNITSGPIGLALFVTAWLYLDSITAAAIDNRGMFLARVGATGPGAQFQYHVDLVHPKKVWTRVTGVVLMPPNVTETIEVRLYAPNGTIYYDAVTLTTDESLSHTNATSPDGNGWTQEEIAVRQLRYLSGRAPLGDPYTKSNLRIGDSIDADSGIIKERTYKFSDHQIGYANASGGGVLDEWPRAADGFDYRINITSTTRYFKTYWPAVGVDRSAGNVWTMRRQLVGGEMTGENYAIYDVDVSETIEGSATNVTETGGWGDGPGREEGGSTDPTALGGLTLELVEPAPNDAPIDMLDEIAKRRQQQLAKPIRTLTLTVAEPRDEDTNEVTEQLIGVIMPGDLIPVIIDVDSINVYDGDVDTFLVVRVTQVSINARDETMTVAIAV